MMTIIQLHSLQSSYTRQTWKKKYFTTCPYVPWAQAGLNTFVSVMDKVSPGLKNGICLTDLTCSTSLQEHILCLRKSIWRFRNAKLKVLLDKFESLEKSIAYLDNTRQSQTQSWENFLNKNFPFLKTRRKIKYFLALLGYY